jgi:hypothetical protein
MYLVTYLKVRLCDIAQKNYGSYFPIFKVRPIIDILGATASIFRNGTNLLITFDFEIHSPNINCYHCSC